jgi:predicted  nucleic acid-binding Zn-ribbon protein
MVLQRSFVVFCFASLGLQNAMAASGGLTLRVNPIRRVVNMLDSMTKKIEAEGAKEQELFDKFMCYCKNGRGALEQSIADAEDKIPKVQAAIDAMGAEVEQLDADIKAAKAGREEAKTALAEGKALRAKEAAAFAKESADFKTNVAAMGKAIAALEKGVGAAFLQTSTASVLRKLSVSMDMSSVDRDVLSSFLSTGQSQEYAPQSGQIIGILKQMHDTMSADLADITATEEAAIKAFDSMAAAKEKEIAALTAEIEDKTARLGENGVKLVNLKEDLEDTEKALEEDKAFLADLDKNCATKEAEWAERQRIRTEELLAVHETIKILNDDDALELFKKTLPTPALLQLKTNARQVAQRAVAALANPRDRRLDLISLALKGKKVSFEKVLGMIDDMVKLLGEEQVSDDDKKAYCEAEIDKTEDELKALERKVSDLDKAIEEHRNAIETVTEEIASLEAGVKALDKEVAEATEQRKEEHAEFVSTLAANNAAVELLGIAKNRLQKFYNPKLYKAPPKRELSAEDRISVNFGGTAPATAAPGGIAGTGVTAFAQADPGAAPETWAKGAAQGAAQESTGVMAMIDMLVADLDKEIQTMEVDEKNAQEEYEELMEASAQKRASDVKSIADKEGAKADLEANLQKLGEESKTTKAEAMAKGKTLMDLHTECDWLLQNFETRKEARAGEVDSLNRAKAVLSGADYSL